MRSIVRAPLVFVASIALVLMGMVVAATPAAAAASLSLDQSTPASVKKTGTTLTTAIFTPPVGSVLVISVQTNGNPNEVKSLAVTDNLTTHLTYNLVQTKGNTTNDLYAKLYWAGVPNSQSMTVTATVGGKSNDYSMLSVLVFTGANTAAPIGASGGGRGATGVINDSYNLDFRSYEATR